MKTVRKPVAAISGPKHAASEPLTDGIRTEKRLYGLLAVMSNEELAGYAEMLISSLGIKGRNELAKADLGLYQTLKDRKLLDGVGLEDLRGKVRDWAAMGEDELVAHAKEFIAGRGIEGRGELKKADGGLYNALIRRKLLDEVGLSDLRGKVRDWAGMEEGELVAFAKEFIAERMIEGRMELAKADAGLYQALRKRELLDAVFSDAESSKHADAVNGVLDALESFGDDS